MVMSTSSVVGRHIDVQAAGADEAEWLETLRGAALPVWQPGPPGRIVVVSPHPDDETLAVGGLLHDLASLGWRVALVARRLEKLEVLAGEVQVPGVAVGVDR